MGPAVGADSALLCGGLVVREEWGVRSEEWGLEREGEKSPACMRQAKGARGSVVSC